MSINITSIKDLHTQLYAQAKASYDSLWDSNILNAEMYSNMLADTNIKMLQIAIDTIMRQELQDLEVESKRNSNEAELEKQWGYDVTRDPVTGVLVLGSSNGNGKIDKDTAVAVGQKLNLDKDLLSKDNQIAISLREITDKEANSLKQREVMEVQKGLYSRQTTSFDDYKYQKVLDSQLQYNAMVFEAASYSGVDVLSVGKEGFIGEIWNKLVLNDAVDFPAPEI